MFLCDVAEFNNIKKNEDRNSRNKNLLLAASGVGLLGVGGYLALKNKKKNLTKQPTNPKPFSTATANPTPKINNTTPKSSVKTPSNIPQKQPINPNTPQRVQSGTNITQPKVNTSKSVYLAIPNDGFSIGRLKDPDYLYEKTQYMRVDENNLDAKRRYSNIVRKQGKPKSTTEKNQFRYLKLDVDEMDNLDSLDPRVNQIDRIKAFRELMRKNPKIRVSGTVNEDLLRDQRLYHR